MIHLLKYSILLLMPVLCCCHNTKIEQPVHNITVSDDCPELSKTIVGIDFYDAVNDFGQPDYCYYFPASRTEDSDTISISVLEAIWLLDYSSKEEARKLRSEVISTVDTHSGTASATLIIDFFLQNSNYRASQVAINL